MKKDQQSRVRFIAQAAMIAAIYDVLTLLGASFSYGEVQVRISEALTILPVFTPAAIPGVFLGCLLSNILGGCVLPDIIFGSLVIVPFVLKYAYMTPLPIPFMMLTVGIGEVISCGVLGLILHAALGRYRGVLFAERS